MSDRSKGLTFRVAQGPARSSLLLVRRVSIPHRPMIFRGCCRKGGSSLRLRVTYLPRPRRSERRDQGPPS